MPSFFKTLNLIRSHFMFSCLTHLDKEINYSKLLFRFCLLLSKTICDSPKIPWDQNLQMPPDQT